MAITFHNKTVVPTNSGDSYSTNPIVVPPPANCAAGDLVVVFVHHRSVDDTIAVSQAGGQTWTTESINPVSTLTTIRLFWCVFNGTWTANPSFSHGGVCCTAVMLVFRPDAGGTWSVDAQETVTSFDAPSTPYDITVSSVTAAANSVVVAYVGIRDDGALTYQAGTGWTAAVDAFNNMAGNDISTCCLYKLMPSAGATGAPVVRETANQADAGQWYTMSFKETIPVTGAVTEALTATDASDSERIPYAITAECLENGRTSLSTNVMSAYHMDETTGVIADVTDNFPLDPDATYPPTYVAEGKFGRCLSFATDRQNINTGFIPNPTNDRFSFSFWFKLNSLANASHAFEFFRAGHLTTPYYVIDVFLETDNKVRFYTRDAQGTPALNNVSSATITETGVWMHLAGTCDGVGQALRLYLNGTKTTGINTLNAAGLLDINSYLTLGNAYPAAANLHLDGSMDEFVFWDDYAITDADAAALYNSGAGWLYPFKKDASALTTEDAEIAVGYSSECTEALTATDSTNASVVHQTVTGTCTEALTATDSTDSTLVHVTRQDTCTEALTATDSTNASVVHQTVTGACTEAVTATDSTNASIVHVTREAACTEELTATDVTDSTLVHQTVTGTCTEALTATDQTIGVILCSAGIIEDVNVTDTSTAVVINNVGITEYALDRTNLKTYWSLGDPPDDGFMCYDLLGNIDLGVTFGYTVDGRIGNATWFDGTGSLDSGVILLDLNGRVVISMWFKLLALPTIADMALIDLGDVKLLIGTDNLVYFIITDTVNQLEGFVYSQNQVVANRWYHVVAVAGGYDTNPELYIDDESVGIAVTPQGTFTDPVNIAIGSYIGGLSAINGIIDEVGLWDTLTREEIGLLNSVETAIAGSIFTDSITEEATAEDSSNATLVHQTVTGACTEALTATDAFSSNVVTSGAVTEVGEATDLTDFSIQEDVANDACTEALIATDSTTALIICADAVTEELTATDSSNATLVHQTLNDVITETASATDSTNATLVHQIVEVACTETASATDSTNSSLVHQTLNDAVTEALTATDIVDAEVEEAVVDLNDITEEIASAIDAVNATILTAAAMVEAITATTDDNGVKRSSATLTESITASDAVGEVIITVSAIIEILSAIEIVDTNANIFSGVLTEDVDAEDLITTIAQNTYSIIETATATDSYAFAVPGIMPQRISGSKNGNRVSGTKDAKIVRGLNNKNNVNGLNNKISIRGTNNDIIITSDN